MVSGFCALLAALLSAWWTRRLCDPSSSLYILDHPNERSLHTQPTPRTGGVAITVAALVAGAVWVVYTGEQWEKSAALGISAAFVAFMSFVDDRRQIEPQYRLMAHFAAAVALLFAGFSIDGNWLPGSGNLPAAVAILVTLLYLVWMLELYNFMDGLDGFAGGMAVAGFGTLAILSSTGGADLIAGLSLVIAAAATGFLLQNFPPARIFMGDVGSATLGVLAAALSVWGAQSGAFPFWAAVLVFSPFIVDATVTLGRRAWRREKIWKPHRTHYYQRLVQLGWSHRRVVLCEYILMAATSMSAIWVVRQPTEIQRNLLLGWVLIYGSLIAFIDVYEMTARRRSPA
jgi:UDP-N-acetylmuramyl pentapeptide phosphotransferase/UDP-N-acetylglucosamine-1-phosphate transferase